MYYRELMKSYEFLVFITHILNATTIQPFLSVFQFYAPAVTQENQIMQLLSARARITGQDSMSDTSVIRVMPWLVLLSEDAWSAANGVEMYQHVRVRSLRKCGGVCYLKVLIGNFRDPETLTFKTRLKAKCFI